MSFVNNKSMKSKVKVEKENNKPNMTISNVGEIVFDVEPMRLLLKKSMGEFFNQKNYYTTTGAIEKYAELIALIEQIPEEDKEYVLKIAEIGRLVGMKEYPLNILAACYHMDRYKGQNFVDEEGKSKIKGYNDAIVRRTKDVNHLIAINKALYPTRLPKQMERNLRTKIESFDAYKLSKGLDRGKTQTLADTIKLLHPNPKNKELSVFYKDVIENKVIVGNNKEQIQNEVNIVKLAEKEKKEVDLEGLVKALYKANLEALLKNLTVYFDYKIVEDPTHLEYIVSKITDEKTIKASKVMPYQFYAAYNAISNPYLGLSNYPNKYKQPICSALSKAIDISVANVQDIKGYSAIIVDLSGSMGTPVNGGDTISCMDMACLLGAIAFKKGNGDVFAFSDDTKLAILNKDDSILTIMKEISKTVRHGCTYLDKALNTIEEYAKQYNLKYDNVLLLSDNDCYQYHNSPSSFKIGDWSNSLDAKVSALIKDGIFDSVWVNNLSSNNYVVVNTEEGNKNLIMGYSEKFITVMNLYHDLRNEKDTKELVDKLLTYFRKESQL